MNPIVTSNDIIETYFRYIMTRFPLGKSDPETRKQVRDVLEKGKDRLFKGPILEIMPPYKKGRSLKSLSKNYSDLVALFSKSGNYPVERELFLHQEKALERILTNNIIVASGTGSGKTECFLFPIMQYCLENPGKGIRAVLIYPLNALVEDQIERLGKYLKGTQITFGKYTGQTPQTVTAAEREKEPANHLISRQEMRSAPPHILITNYAMLEYMLLRPGDSPIIDTGDEHSFKFIVLDEAHTYSGAQGTEVAYLLKRLRHRIGRKAEDIRFVATSATLGGEDSTDKAVKFARRLFGADFTEKCIITGEKETPSENFTDSTTNTYSVEDILKWRLPESDGILTPEEISDKFGISSDGRNPREDIYKHLEKNSQIRRLIQLLETEPKPVSELAHLLFPDKEAENALVNLVAWAHLAKNSKDLLLLPARYHVFVSATMGMFCELAPAGSANFWKNLAISQQDIVKNEGKPYPFEIGVCKVCGEPYIMGVFVYEDGEQKYKPIADSFFETLESEHTESRKVILHHKPIDGAEPYKICRLCGNVNGNCGHSEPDKRVLYLLDTTQKLYNDIEDEFLYEEAEETAKIKTCINCGAGRTLSEAVRPLRFPANGSAAPLVSNLFSHCPEMKVEDLEVLNDEFNREYRRNKDWTPIIANGRKLLIFSDSRQEAAFFGPYMQASHIQFVFSRFMIDLLPSSDSISVEEWKVNASNNMKRFLDDRHNVSLLLEDLRPNLQKNEEFMKELIKSDAERTERIYHSICHLIDGTASSISGLEGIGIAAVYMDDSGFADASAFNDLKSGGLSSKNILALAQLILRYIRLRGVFYLIPEGVDLSWKSPDAYFGYRYWQVVLIDKEDRREDSKSVRLISKPEKNHLTQLQELIRHSIARMKGIKRDEVSTEQANEVICRITNKFIKKELKPDAKGGYQLDMRELSIMRSDAKNGGFPLSIPGGLPRFKSCKKCGRLSWIDLNGMCNYPNCFGELTSPENSLQMSEHNHYRSLLLSGREYPELRAVEHTAQLDKMTAAKDYQREFKKGRINILSCSTTFEMGVDLGDLTTIFMKNVPPGIANYVQRAGRAGRRAGVSPFVLTFCRSLPHDQYFFKNYELLVKGEVKPPAIVLENEKIIKRHFNAVILSDFLKEHREIFSSKDSKYMKDPKLFQLLEPNESFSKTSPAEFLCDKWLPKQSDSYKEKLRAIFLDSSLTAPFFDNIISQFFSENYFSDNKKYGLKASILDRYNQAVIFYQSEKEKYDPRKKEERQQYDFFEKLFEQTRNDQLIQHLSSRGFLPSYAFPTDVVPLDVLSDKAGSRLLDLNRELGRAISEYAPGSTIVANTRIYTSGALKKFPTQVFKKYVYYHCQCNWFTCGENKADVEKNRDKHSENCHFHNIDKHSENCHFHKSQVALYPEWGFTVPRDMQGEKIRTNTRLERSGYSSEFFINMDNFEGEDSITVNLPQKGSIKVEFTNGYDMFKVNPGKSDERQKDKGGFLICEDCGRALKRKGKHKTPYDRNCDGKNYSQSHLISIFDTDVTRITFKDGFPPLPSAVNHKAYYSVKSFWRSVLYALLESISRVLEIERNDIDGLFIPSTKPPFAEFVFIDAVSGGAGHVSRLVGKGGEDCQHIFNEIFSEAKSILDCKDCAENTACYSCLFHHTNQKVQHTLNRGLALEWMTKL
jgi:superfamily II DNA/RNA helicase